MCHDRCQRISCSPSASDLSRTRLHRTHTGSSWPTDFGVPKSKTHELLLSQRHPFLSLESDTLHRLRGFWQWQHHPFSALKASTTWFLFGSLGGTPLKPIQVRSYRSNDSGCLWKEISSQVQHKWPVLSVFVISGWRIQQENRASIDPHVWPFAALNYPLLGDVNFEP